MHRKRPSPVFALVLLLLFSAVYGESAGCGLSTNVLGPRGIVLVPSFPPFAEILTRPPTLNFCASSYTFAPRCMAGENRIPASISVGGFHTCHGTVTEQLKCWGAGHHGQLGNGYTWQWSAPVHVILPTGIAPIAIASGLYHTCAILSSSSVICWGWGLYGQLGNGKTEDSKTPDTVLLPSGTTPVSVVAGLHHTCIALTSGSIVCFGHNSHGQLCDGTQTDRASPVRMFLPDTASAVAAGGWHTCALMTNNDVMCVGSNFHGQLGYGVPLQNVTSAVRVAMPVGIAAASVAAGGWHTCVITTTGSLFCFGLNSNGQLGDGTMDSRRLPTPVALPAGTTAVAVAAGYRHTCVLLSNGTPVCFGANSFGQLGDGTVTDRLSPVQVNLPADSTVVSVSTGGWHTCVQLSNGSLMCFGMNRDAQLSDGTMVDRYSPVKVKRG